jgi:hypothetical protein
MSIFGREGECSEERADLVFEEGECSKEKKETNV